jgi:hypothetical protein
MCSNGLCAQQRAVCVATGCVQQRAVCTATGCVQQWAVCAAVGCVRSNGLCGIDTRTEELCNMHPLGNEEQCWISRLMDYRGQFM